MKIKTELRIHEKKKSKHATKKQLQKRPPTLLRCSSSTSMALGLMLLLHPSSREMIRCVSRVVMAFTLLAASANFFRGTEKNAYL